MQENIKELKAKVESTTTSMQEENKELESSASCNAVK